MEVVGPVFLATDDYFPEALRDLLNEAEGCRQGGFLLGATACARRALDALLSAARAQGGTYTERLESLAERHRVAKLLTSILAQCGDACTADGAKLSAEVLQLFVVAMKAVMYELYVVAPERAERLQYVDSLVKAIGRKSAGDAPMPSNDAAETQEVLQ